MLLTMLSAGPASVPRCANEARRPSTRLYSMSAGVKGIVVLINALECLRHSGSAKLPESNVGSCGNLVASYDRLKPGCI